MDFLSLGLGLKYFHPAFLSRYSMCYFSKDIIDALIEDIDTLVFAFADISKSDNFYVKLKKVDSDNANFGIKIASIFD